MQFFFLWLRAASFIICNLFLNKSERERLLPTFTGQVTSCLSLAWLGALTARCASNMITHIIIFSIIDIRRNTRSNIQLGRVGEHLPYRCDWLNRFHNTVELLLSDTFIKKDTFIQGTQNLVQEKLPHNLCIQGTVPLAIKKWLTRN